MRKFSIFAAPVLAASLALAVPTSAMAQDAAEAATTSAPAKQSLTELSQKLADPEFQEQAAMMGEVMVRMLLDMPVGPMGDALNKATDGRSPAIDPDATVRDLAPGAEELPAQVSEKLPMAMNAMSSMAQGMDAMLPALKDMAERMSAMMKQAK
ncbi:MAG: hypothetical protein ABJH26_07870 [Marinomonas sp.]